MSPPALFFICHRVHTVLYRVYIRSSAAWYRAHRPHTIIAYRFLAGCIPPPHRVLTGRNASLAFHSHFGLCTSNIYVSVLWTVSRRHAPVRNPWLRWSTPGYRPSPPLERSRNGFAFLIPSSYRALTVRRRLYSPGGTFEHVQKFCRAQLAGKVP